MADTATANPTSDDAVAGTWTGSAGSRYTVVDDYPDTGGTDELTHGTTAGTLTFGFTAFSIPAGSTNITVFVDYYDYKNGSQSCTFGGRLKVGGSYFNAATHNPANGAANRTQRTDTWATNPKTSAAWTVAQVNRTDGTNDLQAFGYNSGSDASPTITTSSCRVRVTYDAPANFTLSSTLAAVTVSATATAPADASLSSTLGAITLAATATAQDVSNLELSQTLGAVTLNATATAPADATVSATLGPVTLQAEAEATDAPTETACSMTRRPRGGGGRR